MIWYQTASFHITINKNLNITLSTYSSILNSNKGKKSCLANFLFIHSDHHLLDIWTTKMLTTSQVLICWEQWQNDARGYQAQRTLRTNDMKLLNHYQHLTDITTTHALIKNSQKMRYSLWQKQECKSCTNFKAAIKPRNSTNVPVNPLISTFTQQIWISGSLNQDGYWQHC